MQSDQRNRMTTKAATATTGVAIASQPLPMDAPSHGNDGHDAAHYTYIYPVSPPMVPYYYYSDYGSYPGSPVLHPHPTSPPLNPSNQPIAMSPPAYVLPPLHISSPTVTTPKLSQMSERRYHSLNIYVRGLDESFTDTSFLELCETFGKVQSSKAMIDQKTGTCKGYGFAMYEAEEDCHKALVGLTKAGYQASFARVGQQESFGAKLRYLQDDLSTNLYLSNLPLDITEQKLETLFLPHRTVSNRILRDPRSGMNRGVGFARMSDRTAAMAIIEKYNGVVLEGSSAPLQVRFADTPAQKKLKHDTARQRILRTRDTGVTNNYAMSLGMPVTPETMLGFAPILTHHHAPGYVVPQPLGMMVGRCYPNGVEPLASPPAETVAMDLEKLTLTASPKQQD